MDLNATTEPADSDLKREQGLPPAGCRALLFDANAKDEELALSELANQVFTDSQLLWVDLVNPSEEELRLVADVLSLPSGAIDGYLGTETNPILENCGKCFWLRVVAVDDKPGHSFSGTVLTMIAGNNLVVTLHREPVEFLESFRNGGVDKGAVGTLGAGSFVAALLDWHLVTYFQAVARFEMGVERLEVEVLSSVRRNCIAELRSLRKGASRLRRMLAPHRIVFSALPRPDFRPEEDDQTNRHFRALDTHFERAMDMVENARDLVVGSFELFSSQTALAANETMKILTFATVVIGVLAVIGGILGMNFEAPFFKTGVLGFATAVGFMVLLGAAALLFGHKRNWF